MVFKSRIEAGKKLAEKILRNLDIKKLRDEIVVLAIPRGGVVVGKELSRLLNLPLGVLITRKIGAPGNPELAVGAMGPDGVVVWNQEILLSLGLRPEDLKGEIANCKLKIANLHLKFKIKRINLKGKTVILIDDGIATGATIEAAIAWLRIKKAKRIILAVPVAPPEIIEKLRPMVDKLICLEQPEFFAAVGQFYQEFHQVEDEEVIKILGN